MTKPRNLPFVQDDSDQIPMSSSPVVIDSDTDGASSTTRAKSRASLPATGVKLEWSSGDEGEAAYQALKNRKSLKRKRAHAEARQAKAEQTERKRVPKAAAQGADAPAVGRRSLTSQGKRSSSTKKKASEDADSDLDDQLYDEILPDYVKDRKSKFDKTKARLGEAGLKLPPNYDDIYFSEDERPSRLAEKPVFSGEPRAPDEDIILDFSGGIIPAPTAKWLRPYQVEGAQFLHKKFVYQEGGILGDDMGLGKTIQVIAFLTAAFGKTGDERDARRMRKTRRRRDDRWYPRVLIICPGTLIPNWRAELEKWGWWSVYVYHGTQGKEEALRAASSGMAEIVVTTYDTYRGRMDDVNTIDWDCVIADECHKLKNLTAEVTGAMNNINALCRLGLTGTAIQNNYDELWCLLNWANPGVLGPRSTWRQAIGIPLRIGQAHDASVSELATARRTAQSLVKNLLPRFFLRRTKAIIADQMPKKSDRVVFCPLTDSQAEAYENFVMSDICMYIRESGELCDCASLKTRGRCHYKEIPEDRGPWQNFIFPAIQTLIKISNHIALLPPVGNDPSDKQERAIDTLEIAIPDGWKDLYNNRENIVNYANEEYCGKWKVLKRLLSLWHQNGDKVLIFSHNVRLLTMMRHLFMATTTYNLSYLDGKMSYEERQKEVDDFNSNPLQFVFLISSKAGGVGLNITSANKVVILDPNWNPSHDLQAQDRAYRLGQTRDVECFRLVSAATIEEIVYARQVYKQQQANIGYNASSERRYFTGVQDSSSKKGEIFGVKNLFAYQGDHVLLREIVNKTNIAETKAGVMIADLDLSQANDHDDDFFARNADSQDAVINQLVERIKKGIDQTERPRKEQSLPVKRSDPIQGILASVGVEYTHENSEVIGTSKIESRLSRRALEGTEKDLLLREPVFGKHHLDRSLVVDPEEADDADEVNGEVNQTNIIDYRYRPSVAIRKRQFCTMAKYFGFDDVTEFALVVEGWTQEERRNCLEKFYAWRRRVLFGEDELREVDQVSEDAIMMKEDVLATRSEDSMVQEDVNAKTDDGALNDTKQVDDETTDDEL